MTTSKARRWRGAKRGSSVAPGLRAALAAVLATGALAPSSAWAQERAGPEAGRELSPSRGNLGAFTGVLAPLNDLTSDPSSFGTSQSVSPVLGVDAAFWPGRGSFGLGLQGLFAPGDLQVEATDFPGAIPDDLGDARYLAATATLLYRLRLSGARGRVEPYFGVGGGVRRLTVDPIAEPEVEDSTDPLGTLVAGTWVWFSHRLAIRFEVRDHLLDFESPTTGESRIQNDVSVTVGLGTRIR